MKKHKQKVIPNPKSIVNLDFHYQYDILEIEKQTKLRYPDCDNDYHSGDEDIISVRISKLNSYTKLFDFIIESLNFKDLSTESLYCVDRILRINKIYDTSVFDVDTHNGYYGDEIDKIHIDNGIANIIDWQIKTIISSTNKIEDILNFEYGYILDKLQNKKYEIREKIPFSQLKVGNDNYYRKLSKDSAKYELIPGLPVGVYIEKDDGTYRLVDGYHRFASLDKQKSYSIIVAV